jgi:hypothetical protein
MPSLNELKGQKIVVFLLAPLIEQQHPVHSVKLVEVESSGIWIEDEDFGAFMHAKLKNPILERQPLFFVPFAQIGWIFSTADYPSLSEKGFGL